MKSLTAGPDERVRAARGENTELQKSLGQLDFSRSSTTNTPECLSEGILIISLPFRFMYAKTTWGFYLVLRERSQRMSPFLYEFRLLKAY